MNVLNSSVGVFAEADQSTLTKGDRRPVTDIYVVPPRVYFARTLLLVPISETPVRR